MKKIFLLMMIFGVLVTPFYAANTKAISEKAAKKDLKKIEKKLRVNKTKIKRKKIAKRIAEKDLILLARELKQTETGLRKTKRKLRNITQKKINTEKKHKQLMQLYYEKSERASARLVDIYKTKDENIINLLLNPKSHLIDLDAFYIFEKLIKSDVQLMESLKQEYTALEKLKGDLENQIRDIKQLKGEISSKEYLLVQRRRKKSRYITSLQIQINNMKLRNQELEKNSQDLAKAIQKLGKGKDVYYGTGRLIKPVKGWVSSRYGYRRHPIFKRRIFHRGVDIAAPRGYKIKASDSGVVIVAGREWRYRGYGKVTVIDHGRRKKDKKRMSTVYAHQSRILVKEGDFVKKGQEIGWVGSTGYSTGPHLHFEVRLNGKPRNPKHFVKL